MRPFAYIEKWYAVSSLDLRLYGGQRPPGQSGDYFAYRFSLDSRYLFGRTQYIVVYGQSCAHLSSSIIHQMSILGQSLPAQPRQFKLSEIPVPELGLGNGDVVPSGSGAGLSYSSSVHPVPPGSRGDVCLPVRFRAISVLN